MVRSHPRRDFLARAAVLGLASLSGLPRVAGAEPPPEITTIRLPHTPAICIAPQYLAEKFLRLEGFTDVRYVEVGNHPSPVIMIETGEADFSMDSAAALVYSLGNGEPIQVLGGIHAGCYELFGNERVRAIRDLKGKTIAISGFGGGDHVLVSSMLAYVGIDPRKNVKWVMGRMEDGMQLFIDGKADAFMGFAPQPQELRALEVGRVIIDTAQDRPWSQYFCCMVAGNRDFVARYPVATKRALRAYLKAADLCAGEPERVASYLVEKGFEPRYAVALDVLTHLPYKRWRTDNPEATLRFLALRLHEVGMIKTPPNELVARGTDWRYLNEIRRELKA